MCVGFTNGFEDFSPLNLDLALKSMVPGSAVSFNRIALDHFAIFLGWALPPRDEESAQPIPLLCHLSGEVGTQPKASVRLEDVRDVVESSVIRVFKCSCSVQKRATVIKQCLDLVGRRDYNIVTNNCEHFVRWVINGNPFSFQVLWFFLLPMLSIPRLVFGGSVSGARTSSFSLGGKKGLKNKSLGLLDPEGNFIEMKLFNHGLNLVSSVNETCTRRYLGNDLKNTLAPELAICRSCLTHCHQRLSGNLYQFEGSGICECTVCDAYSADQIKFANNRMEALMKLEGNRQRKCRMR